jgi:hypothetical protein
MLAMLVDGVFLVHGGMGMAFRHGLAVRLVVCVLLLGNRGAAGDVLWQVLVVMVFRCAVHDVILLQNGEVRQC